MKYFHSFFKITIFLIPFVVLVTSSCNNSNQDKTPSSGDRIPVARVYDKTLYADELQDIIANRASKKDSSDIVNRYAQLWVNKQLMLNEAEEEGSIDPVDLQRRIEEYKYNLIVHAYEREYIGKYLNAEVTEEEINDYYNSHKKEFELKQNIIRGIFIKVPNSAQKIDQVKSWLKSSHQDAKDELKGFCFTNAVNFHVEDSVWIDFDEIIKSSEELKSIPNKTSFIRKNKYVEVEEGEYICFLRIDEYKIVDQLSPVSFEKEKITRIILSKRTVELKKSLEKKIIDNAKEGDDYEIYKK